MALGANVKAFRANRKWDQPTLSEKAKVDIGTISALETRDSARSQYTAQLAAAFGVSIEELLSGDDPITRTGKALAKAPPPKADPAHGLSPRAIEVAQAWMKLPTYKQDGYAQGILVDAAVVGVFPEIERAMKMAATLTNPRYHVLTEKFSTERAKIIKQGELFVKTDP